MKKIVLIVMLGLLFGCANTVQDESDELGIMDLDEESESMHVESIDPELSEDDPEKENEEDSKLQVQDEQDSNDNQQVEEEKVETEEVEITESSNEDESEKQEPVRVTEPSHEPATSISSDIPSEIAELLNDNIGFVYQNLSTGERISHNENKFFYAASTVKTIIGMQLVDMNADFNMLVEKTRSDYEGGNGNITQADFGDKFPLKEVVYEMIANSDNTATHMAFRVGRSDSFWKYAKHYSDSNGHVRLFDGSNSVTPGYMADALVHLYKYSEKYDYIIDCKHQAKDMFNLVDASIPYAKKPGRFGAHNSQIGIVYDDDPYVFAIYVQNGVNQDTMQKISTRIYELHSN